MMSDNNFLKHQNLGEHVCTILYSVYIRSPNKVLSSQAALPCFALSHNKRAAKLDGMCVYVCSNILV